MVDDRVKQGARTMLAANLRRMRIARHLSLSELAKAAEMSKATLSGIENAHANPTVETLVALALALGVSLGELLAEAPHGEIHVVRAAHTPGEHSPQRQLEAIPSGGAIEISELMLAARELYEVEPHLTGVRAHLYVIKGKLVAGPVERSTELVSGDYASFPADVPHVFQAGRQPCHALLLTSSGG